MQGLEQLIPTTYQGMQAAGVAPAPVSTAPFAGGGASIFGDAFNSIPGIGDAFSSLQGFGSGAMDWLGDFGGGDAGGGAAGAAGSILGGIGGIMGMVNGGKQLKLSKDMYGSQLDMYNQDAGNQAQALNTRLEDRQIARIAAQGEQAANARYGSLSDYMDKNRVTVNKIG